MTSSFVPGADFASGAYKEQAVPDPWQPVSLTVPLWYQRGLVTAVGVVVGPGVLGLVAADIGVYRFWPVILVGLTMAAVLVRGAWPRRPWTMDGQPAETTAGHWPAGTVALVAAASAVWNGAHGAVHIAVGRDPGVYTQAALWIVKHGNLQIPTTAVWNGPWPVKERLPGTNVGDSTHLQFVFAHLLPVLMAEAHQIGGDRLIQFTPAVLTALGLCAIYAVGCRLVTQSWFVVAAVIAVAVCLPEIRVARDALSESAAQFLLWGGLGLLLMALDRGRFSGGLLAGLAFGATVCARIDAVVFLIPLPLLGAVALLAASPGRRRVARLRVFTGCLIGCAVGVAIALVDVNTRAGNYAHALKPQLFQLYGALALSFVAGLVVLVVAPRTRSTAFLQARAGVIGTVVGAVTGLLLIGAWFVRPRVQVAREATQIAQVAGLQRLEHLTVDPYRDYAEHSMVWMSWYVGPVVLAVGIVGAALAVRRGVRGDGAAALVLSTAGMGTGLYLWHPGIVPDQIWASRRFVTAAIPLVALCAALAIALLVRRLPLTWQVGWRSGGMVLVATIGLAILPILNTRPVAGVRTQTGFAAVVAKTCTLIGPDAAVVIAVKDGVALTAAGALRTVCGVPVAVASAVLSPAQKSALAARWKSQGRTLWLVTSSAKYAQATGGTGSALQLAGHAVNMHELPLMLDRVPDKYHSDRLTLMAETLS